MSFLPTSPPSALIDPPNNQTAPDAACNILPDCPSIQCLTTTKCNTTENYSSSCGNGCPGDILNADHGIEYPGLPSPLAFGPGSQGSRKDTEKSQRDLDEKRSGTFITMTDSDPQVEDRSVCTWQQFGQKAAILTFGCMLIISYVALIQNAAARTNQESPAGWFPYNLSMFFAFIAIVLHASGVALACRGAVQCYNFMKRCDEINDTNHYVCTDRILASTIMKCEYLHLGGTAFFILTVWASSLVLFENAVYPAIFSALSLWVLLVFTPTKYRANAPFF